MKWSSVRGWIVGCGVLAALISAPIFGIAGPQPGWAQACQLNPQTGSACILNFSDGRAAVSVDATHNGRGRWGFIDPQGRMAVAPNFARVRPFSNGLAAVYVGGRWGYIDKQGGWVLPPRFTDASFFNTKGTAFVRSEGTTQLINARGEVLQSFAPEVTPNPDFGRAFQYGVGLAEMRTRTPVLLWNAQEGSALMAAPGVTDIAPPQDNLIPAQQTEGESTSWGFVNRQGKWMALPASLNGGSEPPLHQRGIYAVTRSAQPGGQAEWQFVNAYGRPESPRRYKTVQVLRPGVWLVQTMMGRWALLNTRLQVLHELEGDFSASQIETFAQWTLLATKTELLLVGPEALINTFPTESLPRLKRQRGLLWVETDTTFTPSGRELRLLISPQGQNILDDETRRQLWRYTVRPTSLQDKPPSVLEPLPLATLMPTDPRQFRAILSASGKIVVNRLWDTFQEGPGLEGPLVVRSTTGLYGAINANGQWVIPPRFESIQGFDRGFSWARRVDENPDTDVIINARGDVVTNLPGLTLNSKTDILSEGVVIFHSRQLIPGGVWHPGADHVALSEPFDRIDRFIDGLARVSVNGRWGVIDRQGRWVIEPRYEGASPDTLNRLGTFTFWASRPTIGDGYSQEAYRLISATTGLENAGSLSQKPMRVSPGRYLTRPLSGGIELLNDDGKVLLSDTRPVQEVKVKNGWVHILFLPQFGIVDSMGQWRLAPEFMGNERPSSPQSFDTPADSDGLTVFADKQKKYGLMDASQKQVVPPRFDYLLPMFNGRSVAQAKGQHGDKLGYIDNVGRFVIPPQFESAMNFQSGYALVSRQGVTQFINSAGEVVVRFRPACDQLALFNPKGEQTWPPHPVSCAP